MNYFTDNADIQDHFREGVPWGDFVPLWEEGFRLEEGPSTLAEARELYGACLTEVGEYAAREIAPRAREIDEVGVRFHNGAVVHPEGLLKNIEGLRKMGVLAVSLPRDQGGFNFPHTVGAILVEMLSRACTNTLLLYAFHQGPALLILRFGTREQVERWVRPLAEGEISGAVAMTEADAGSDVGNLSTRAEPDGPRFRIHGRKQFITNGCGEVCVVLARTEPGSRGLEGLSLLVAPRLENGRENYRVARPENKFVIRGSATCELAFDGTSAEILGDRGQGFAEILGFMNQARLAVALQGLGLSQAALSAAQEYASRRVQMGRPIARHELVADMLLDMEAELGALRALAYTCSALQDRILGLERSKDPGTSREAAVLQRALRDRIPLVKWFGAERTLALTRMAVQVHGGYGVVQEYDVERHYRNALILPIYEGTSQIQALMSLKDQVRWALERPVLLARGPVNVEAPFDPLGDALREMAFEYNRSLRFVLRESVGFPGLVAGALGFRALPADRMGPALVAAERLVAILAHLRAAEALVSHAGRSGARRRLAERFVHRALPLARMHGEVIRSGDRSTLEALRG